MRKRLVPQPLEKPAEAQPWLDLSTATVEITSEDPNHPIECALLRGDADGWRADEPGVQRIRIQFDHPQELRRISLTFVETAAARTQEFALRWSRGGNDLQEIVRQQWNFSPEGATQETEDYQVHLSGVTVLELTIKPEISGIAAYASLRRMRLA
jgi:hypothetical protein